ncbi:MAG TPA: hypothetical protein VEA69_18240, partial [Tepidisphaeraceae bacterium]|nr:hypothetical protein [Tepidisphaeraceae bacterium]
ANWNDVDKSGKDYHQKYREWLEAKFEEFANSKVMETRPMCTAMPTSTLVEFAEQNGLPLSFEDQQKNPVRSFELSRADFLKGLFGSGKKDDWGIIHPDTIGNLGDDGKFWKEEHMANTIPIAPKDVRTGDLFNRKHYKAKLGVSRGGHTVTVISRTGPNQMVIGEGCEKQTHSIEEYAKNTGMEPRRWHPSVFQPKPKAATQPAK